MTTVLVPSVSVPWVCLKSPPPLTATVTLRFAAGAGDAVTVNSALSPSTTVGASAAMETSGRSSVTVDEALPACPPRSPQRLSPWR